MCPLALVGVMREGTIGTFNTSSDGSSCYGHDIIINKLSSQKWYHARLT
jgi:hypothetical protein